MIEAVTSTTEGPKASPRPHDGGSPRRRPRPLVWAASAAAAAAVGVAAALLAAPEPPVPQPPLAERALASAADDAARLAVVAGAVAASGPEASRVAADRAATVLGLQAAVLSERPRYPEDDAEPSPAPSSSGPAAAQAAAPGNLARQLAESAGRRLADVPRVDGATAAALASLAAGQLLAARSLEPLAVTGTGTDATGGLSQEACPSPRPDPAAFAAVQAAEAAGVWTYTVLAARAAGEQRSQRLEAASAHETQLGLLERAAGEDCVALPPRAPGAALPAEAESAASLAALEESAAQAWAELVGETEGGARASAAQGLAVAAARRAAVAPLEPAAAAFPGHRPAQEAAASLAGGDPASPAAD